MADPIRVLLADDHPLIRAGIRAILSDEEDVVVVGEAKDAHEVQSLCVELTPDVLLLDLSMPGPPPMQTAAFLRDHNLPVKVVALTAHNDDAYIRGLMVVGVDGYVLKDEAPDVIAQAIRTVCRGGTWFSRAVAEKTADMQAYLRDAADEPVLSARELEVLSCVAEGLANKEIAARLGVSEKTIEFHMTNIRQKKGGGSRVDLAIWGKSNGLVPGT